MSYHLYKFASFLNFQGSVFDQDFCVCVCVLHFVCVCVFYTQCVLHFLYRLTIFTYFLKKLTGGLVGPKIDLLVLDQGFITNTFFKCYFLILQYFFKSFHGTHKFLWDA